MHVEFSCGRIQDAWFILAIVESKVVKELDGGTSRQYMMGKFSSCPSHAFIVMCLRNRRATSFSHAIQKRLNAINMCRNNNN